MRPSDELNFHLDLPYPVAEVRDRLRAACDTRVVGGGGTGLCSLWGSVGDGWFRVRANNVSLLTPAADGRMESAGSGSRVVVTGKVEPEEARFAWTATWGVPAGVGILLVGLTAPGARVPAALVGTTLIVGGWAARQWRRNSAKRTRLALTNVLTGPAPSPAKWRPRLPAI